MSEHSSGESLDFNNLDGTDLDSATRQFFRISIDKNNDYFVKIKQKKYSLADVSINGVSFFVKSGTEFPIGTILSDCELIFNKESIKGLKGKIVHNSSEPVKSNHTVETQWLCGMLWEDIGGETEERLVSGFEILKKDILSKNNVSDMDMSE